VRWRSSSAATVQLPEVSRIKTLARLAYMIAAAALFVGCGGSTSPIGAEDTMAQASTHRRQPYETLVMPSYKVSGQLLYVTNYNPGYNNVTVYRANDKDPAPIATISDRLDFPAGDCQDSHGTLYVTNEPAGSGGWISEYPLGKTTASEVITNGISTAGFCAVDSEDNLWVTNVGGPNVTEYLYRSKKPHTVITKGLAFPVGIAIDHSGNLYVSDRQNSDVVVYAPGSKTPSRTITDGVTSPVGIAIDGNGVLYVTNITENNVEEYRPGENQPFQTITQGLSVPDDPSVNQKGWLYVANFEESTTAEFPPGSTMPSKRQISKDVHAPQGLAIYPAVLP
jgi:hypothetical protein